MGKSDTRETAASDSVSAASSSAETIEKAKRERSAKSDSGRGTAKSETRSVSEDQALAMQQTLEDILDPKVWKGVVGAPGDMMHQITKREHWVLSNDEKDTLAKTGAATFRSFAITDPKWIALTLFSTSVLTIYGGRMLKDMQMNNEKKKQEQEKQVNPTKVSGGKLTPENT